MYYKIYFMCTKHTECVQNILNMLKIYWMCSKYTECVQKYLNEFKMNCTHKIFLPDKLRITLRWTKWNLMPYYGLNNEIIVHSHV